MPNETIPQKRCLQQRNDQSRCRGSICEPKIFLILYPRIVTTWSLFTCRGPDKRAFNVTALRIANSPVHMLGFHRI
jgi:hypothetical protein